MPTFYLDGPVIFSNWCDQTTAGTSLSTGVTNYGGWCDQTTGGTGAMNLAWYAWQGTGVSSNATTITTANAANVWISWITADTTVGSTIIRAPAVHVDGRTPEEIAAFNARAREEGDRHRAAATAARDKAWALLLSMLDVKQREQLQTQRFFDVIARHSKRRYRIEKGAHANVLLVDDQGRPLTRYCGQPGGIPEGDVMLAQKLQIEYDEPEYLRHANGSRVA